MVLDLLGRRGHHRGHCWLALRQQLLLPACWPVEGEKRSARDVRWKRFVNSKVTENICLSGTYHLRLIDTDILTSAINSLFAFLCCSLLGRNPYSCPVSELTMLAIWHCEPFHWTRNK